MKSIKRAPLWGRIVMIILTLITIITLIKYIQLEKINDSLNVTINEQTKVIEILENENKDLTEQILQLKSEKTEPKRTAKANNNNSKPKISNDGKSLGKFKISAYCHCSKCCGKSDGITATGTKATANRTIAVDPNVIPLGSEVMIDGNIYVAEDTGGGIKGNRVDMYFSTHQEALNWGIQNKEISLVLVEE